tara:strand:+ start:174 stop:536 length:363 start_codon:yes stop_codon:yes gene_type:complete
MKFKIEKIHLFVILLLSLIVCCIQIPYFNLGFKEGIVLKEENSYFSDAQVEADRQESANTQKQKTMERKKLSFLNSLRSETNLKNDNSAPKTVLTFNINGNSKTNKVVSGVVIDESALLL